MTPKQFVKSLDIRNDFRTYWNFAKLPFIILIRIPLVLTLWFCIWLGEYIDRWDSQHTIPGWERYKPKKETK